MPPQQPYRLLDFFDEVRGFRAHSLIPLPQSAYQYGIM
jgi:hypothetical protein